MAEGSSQPIPTLPWVLGHTLIPQGGGEREERVGELSRYRVKGPTALPDAVCVEHVEDAAEDSRVCNEKAWHCNGMAQRSQGLQRAQHSTAQPKSTLRFLPRDSSPAKLRKKTKGPWCIQMPKFPDPPTPPARGGWGALTQLPAAHVIELCAEEQSGDDMDDGEDDPEGCVPFAENL